MNDDSNASATSGNDSINGSAGADTIDGLAGNDTILGGAGNDSLLGGAGDDSLTGGDGDDTLIGGAGDDQLFGGKGSDTAAFTGVFSTSTVTAIFGGKNGALSGYRVAGVDGTDTLSTDIEFIAFGASLYRLDSGRVRPVPTTGNDFVEGSSSADTIDGLAGNDTLYGFAGADSLSGGDGDDLLNGGGGDDQLSGGSGTDTAQFTGAFASYRVTATYGAALGGGKAGPLTGYRISGPDGTDTVSTDVEYLVFDQERFALRSGAVVRILTDGSDSLEGGPSADAVDGLAGNDTILGGADNDTLDGGAGNDTADFSDKTASVVVTLNGATSATVTVGGTVEDTLRNIENLIGGSGADSLTGDSLDNLFRGGAGNDTLDGGAGSDTADYSDKTTAVVVALNGATNATVTVGSTVEDTLRNIENLIGGSGADSLAGDSLDNLLRGGAGNDTLDGGAGSDTADYSDKTVAVVIKLNGAMNVTATVGGTAEDTLRNIENLIGGTGADALTGDSNANLLSGGSGADSLVGGTGNDTLDGGAGGDSLTGGLGDDLYVVDSAGDIVTESANEGLDTIRSSASYTLPANVENLTLTGSASINGTGNALANSIIGNEADNILNGSGGVDTLAGGAGNDLYVVNHPSVNVIERGDEGNDTVRSSINYTLGANLENLILVGASATVGTGNALDNVLTGNARNNSLIGNAGNDTLDGGTGSDSMIGGSGDDLYIVDTVGDLVTEVTNEGTDTIRSSVTYTLPSNVENLTLTGSGSINGRGNGLNNYMVGNGRNNILDGGIGADTMLGGAGNDVFLIDDIGDIALESLGEGQDTVQSSVSYTLPDNVEDLNLLGTAAISGSGNALANTLRGNAGANMLSGGRGSDTLIGYGGSDIFDFAPGDSGQASGFDMIRDYTKGAVGFGDLIRYSTPMRIGGSAAAPTSTEASINLTTAVASFASRSGATLADALGDLAARFTAASDAPGEIALFRVNGAGSFYLFISDGNAGVTANDVVIELTGLRSIGRIDLTAGNLTIIA